MKKTAIRILALIFSVVLLLPIFTSCDEEKEDVYTLGGYKISDKEYNYLFGMFKKKALVSLGYTNSQLGYEIEDGVTLGQYLESLYREEFDYTVISLLYTEAMFDKLGLSLSYEDLNTKDAVVSAMIAYYGGYSEKNFNKLLKDNNFGFDSNTLRTVYEKQLKQTAVMKHLYGENGEKLSDEGKRLYYLDSYLHFQIITINTLYKEHTDSQGKTTYVNLTEDEMKYKKQLRDELVKLLVEDDKSFNYVILKDDLSLSYEELWKKYSDEKTFSQGYYMVKPAETDYATSDTVSTANNLLVGDCGSVVAKRYYDSKDSILADDNKTEIKEGDFFSYGTTIIKKLELDEGAYKDEKNKDFFPESTFLNRAIQFNFKSYINTFAEQNDLTVSTSKTKDEYNFTNITPNEIDYYYFYGESEE